MSTNMMNGIVLIVLGVVQILNFAVFPVWLILLCVGVMYIINR